MFQDYLYTDISAVFLPEIIIKKIVRENTEVQIFTCPIQERDGELILENFLWKIKIF